jgi:hypothetical protein
MCPKNGDLYNIIHREIGGEGKEGRGSTWSDLLMMSST